MWALILRRLQWPTQLEPWVQGLCSCDTEPRLHFLSPQPCLEAEIPQGATTPDLILIALHTSSHLTAPNLVLSHQTARLQRLQIPCLPGPTLPSSFLQQLGQIAGGLKCLRQSTGAHTSPRERRSVTKQLGKHDEAGPKTGRLKKAGLAPSSS